MKRIFPIAVCLLAAAIPSVACSTFFINRNGQMVFGRNYDWIAGSGLVCTNQRGLDKTSYPVGDGGTIAWTSQYGSITFNQYGKEFPTGGMNEKGLVVELMWLDETQYPGRDNRPAIGVLQWIQYQLDNCATVEEVIATDKALRITSTSTPLHYLVADANGQAATIEYLNGKLVAHRGDALPFAVLTNSTYAESAQYAKDAMKHNLSTRGYGSKDRFATACAMIRQYQWAPAGTSLTDQSFAILDAVSQGSHTKWSIVYDITRRQVHFRTLEAGQVKSVSFAAFDFGCRKPAKALDINTQSKDDVTGLFRVLGTAAYGQYLHTAARLSRNEVQIPVQEQEGAIRYASRISCRE